MSTDRKEYLIPVAVASKGLKAPWPFRFDAEQFYEDFGDEWETIPDAAKELEAFGHQAAGLCPINEGMFTQAISYAKNSIKQHIIDKKQEAIDAEQDRIAKEDKIREDKAKRDKELKPKKKSDGKKKARDRTSNHI